MKNDVRMIINNACVIGIIIFGCIVSCSTIFRAIFDWENGLLILLVKIGGIGYFGCASIMLLSAAFFWLREKVVSKRKKR